MSKTRDDRLNVPRSRPGLKLKKYVTGNDTRLYSKLEFRVFAVAIALTLILVLAYDVLTEI